jgi:hypothetical protein
MLPTARHAVQAKGRKKNEKQPHAKGTTFDAVRSENAFRDAVSIASRRGKAPMPDAWRNQSGRTEGKPKRVEAWTLYMGGKP